MWEIQSCMDAESDTKKIKARLNELRTEHRDLDLSIENLNTQSKVDIFAVQRLKKRKLGLKDQIAHMESLLLPDIIA